MAERALSVPDSQPTAGGDRSLIERREIDRLLADRFSRDAMAQSNLAWCREHGISEATLRRIGDVLRRGHAGSGEAAAVAGFRLGCEAAWAASVSGTMARDFGLGNSEWCRKNNVASSAIERVAETVGTCPDPRLAAVDGFQLGHEAAMPLVAA